VKLERPHAVVSGEQSFNRLLLALLPVNRLRLVSIFIHREYQASIQQLFIKLDGCRRQKDRHRALHPVLMRHQLPRRRIFAGDAIVRTPSLCRSFKAYAARVAPSSSTIAAPCASDPSRPCNTATAPSSPSIAPCLLPARIPEWRPSAGSCPLQNSIAPPRQAASPIAARWKQDIQPACSFPRLPHRKAQNPSKMRSSRFDLLRDRAPRCLLRTEFLFLFLRIERLADLLVSQSLQLQKHPPQILSYHILLNLELLRGTLDENNSAAGPTFKSSVST